MFGAGIGRPRQVGENAGLHGQPAGVRLEQGGVTLRHRVVREIGGVNNVHPKPVFASRGEHAADDFAVSRSRVENPAAGQQRRVQRIP